MTEWEIQNWTVGLAQSFFGENHHHVKVSTTSPTRQALFDDFFGTFWRLTKTQPHFVGKKGSFNLSVEQKSQRSSFEASGFIAFSPVFQLENLEKLGEVAA